MRSEKRMDGATVNPRAVSMCGEHDAVLIDRSHKGSGLLLETLGS